MFLRFKNFNKNKPSGQNRQKSSLKEGSALKIQCHVVKNTLLHCFFGEFPHWDPLYSTLYILFISEQHFDKAKSNLLSVQNLDKNLSFLDVIQTALLLNR